MTTMRKTFIAYATVAAFCVSCGNHSLIPSHGPTGSEPTMGTTAGASHPPLVRSHLAPGQVGTVPAGLHCRMSGGSPTAYRPDPACTPGAVDEAVTQSNIDSTICRSGYTTKVRPPVSATDEIKRAMYTAYGDANGTPSELDHLVSLELGGSNDTANLWPEPGALPNPKDSVENALHKAVCAHKITLTAAQQAIATDWTTALTVTGAGR